MEQDDPSDRELEHWLQSLRRPPPSDARAIAMKAAILEQATEEERTWLGMDDAQAEAANLQRLRARVAAELGDRAEAPPHTTSGTTRPPTATPAPGPAPARAAGRQAAARPPSFWLWGAGLALTMTMLWLWLGSRPQGGPAPVPPAAEFGVHRTAPPVLRSPAEPQTITTSSAQQRSQQSQQTAALAERFGAKPLVYDHEGSLVVDFSLEPASVASFNGQARAAGLPVVAVQGFNRIVWAPIR
jgi:hypothetical protein